VGPHRHGGETVWRRYEINHARTRNFCQPPLSTIREVTGTRSIA
jgi:hypothetical protein